MTTLIAFVLLANCTTAPCNRPSSQTESPKQWSPNYVPATEKQILDSFPSPMRRALPMVDSDKHPFGSKGLEAAYYGIRADDIYSIGYGPDDPGKPRPTGLALEPAKAFFNKHPRLGKDLARLSKLHFEGKRVTDHHAEYLDGLLSVLMKRAVVAKDENRTADAKEDILTLIRFAYAWDHSFMAHGDYRLDNESPRMVGRALSYVRLAIAWGIVGEKERRDMLKQLPGVPRKDWWAIGNLRYLLHGRDLDFLTHRYPNSEVTFSVGLPGSGTLSTINLVGSDGNLDGPATAQLMGKIAQQAVDAADLSNGKAMTKEIELSIINSAPELFGNLTSERLGWANTAYKQTTQKTPNSLGLLWAHQYAKEARFIVNTSRNGWTAWAKLRDLLENGE